MPPDPIPQAIYDELAGECVALRVRMINRAVTAVYDDALRPLGLRVSQMNILVAAAKMGVARPAEICAKLHIEPSTLSRNVDRMVARGWLERVPDEDARAAPFRITKQGERLLTRDAYPRWREAQAKAVGLLGAKGAAAMGAAVKRLG